MDEKVVISLVSVFVGTALTFLMTMGRELWAGRKLKQGLLTELGDLQIQLERTMVITKRQLQIHANSGIDVTGFALPLSNLFFKTYFKDVFGKLNANQRTSYQLIHGSVDARNRDSESLQHLAEKLREEFVSAPETLTEAKLKRWEEDLVGFYKGVMVLRWHIAYHQKYPEAPNYSLMSETHETYLVFIKELDESVDKLLESAKALGREGFESRAFDIETVRRHRQRSK